jgi:hypothetical protein
MGEADDQIPAVLAKYTSLDLTKKTVLDSATMSAKDCLFMNCSAQIEDSN